MSTIVYINAMSNIKKIGERQKAAEMMAFDPDITVEMIARKLDVNVRTVVGWRADPNFVDMVYQMYMVEFGAEIPSVLSSMIREAKAGTVQAGRLVLEHSGKLVKNINVTIDSPFEKYLQAEKAEVEYMDAEVQDIVEDVPDMPAKPYNKMFSDIMELADSGKLKNIDVKNAQGVSPRTQILKSMIQQLGVNKNQATQVLEKWLKELLPAPEE